ncbi:MAG: nucleotidyltransferase domain-containing protein [Deltaproteobacteria bacterium]|nr:nucleotidyltransferase domain-containing protein [Deltaproteobacteria bacterium]
MKVQEERCATLRREGRKKARAVAALLREKYGVRKVILIGSLARAGYVHPKSDIDLLVDGLRDRDLLRAGYDA